MVERLFITTKDAAIIMGVSHRTLAAWIRDGVGPPVRRFGSGKRQMIRIRYPLFMKWIEKPPSRKHNRKRPPSPEELESCTN